MSTITHPHRRLLRRRDRRKAARPRQRIRVLAHDDGVVVRGAEAEDQLDGPGPQSGLLSSMNTTACAAPPFTGKAQMRPCSLRWRKQCGGPSRKSKQ
jgi:hypothetical protein